MREDDTPCCEQKFWVYLMICLVLLTFAGITSGLSLGFFTYSLVDLEVLAKAGLPHQRKNAVRILPIVQNQYLLLCTLLIAKSMAFEAVPIFLDRIFPFWAAVLISATIVVAFAEVIPQAVCSRYGLSFSAKFVPFVLLLQVVVFPVSYPVSKLLDWLLGKDHSVLFGRGQLRTLVDLLSIKAGRGGELTDEETTIITGALDMNEKTAKDAMTPIAKTFSLDINVVLDVHTMGLIMSKGHSRVPFYSDNPKNIIGLVMVKNLIFCDPEDKVPLKNITLRRIHRVYDDWPLYDVLRLFQKGHSHMAIVVRSQKPAPELLDVRIQSNSEIPVTQFKVNSPKSSDDIKARISVVGTPCKISNVSNKWEEETGNISVDELESLKTRFADEDVIGIITMEDVIEELLQEEILDENDLSALNKIRMNYLPWMRSASSSPRASSGCENQWRTPPTSYYSSPILHSPVTPLTRPALYASPGKSGLGSPAGSFRCSSPVSSNRVYEFRHLKTGLSSTDINK